MPQRKEEFINDEFYHVVSRAIDNNLIFRDTDDYFRGIFSIYEFNNANPVNIFNRRRDRIVEKKTEKPCEVGHHTNLILDNRDKFAEVLSFCFMPNHIHLMLKQLKDNGITEFMRKMGGYGRYFNKKYERKGYVFQDRFKSVHIENDIQLMAVFNYIHTNPLSLIEPGWKEKGIKNPLKAIKFLENYKWSSYQDFIGKKNFPSVTSRDFLLETMGGIAGCKSAIKNRILNKRLSVFEDLNNLFIE